MHEHSTSHIIIMQELSAIMHSGSHTDHSTPFPFPSPIDQPYVSDPTWTTLGDYVTQTIKRTSPNKKKNPSSYNQVHALLINWEDDDLDTNKEIDDLQQLFEQSYCFIVEKYSIPSCGSSNKLEMRIFQFRQSHDDPSNLLIVYYGGHGDKNDANRSIWMA